MQHSTLLLGVINSVVLPITRRSKHHGVWDANCWRDWWQKSVVVNSGSHFDGTVPNFKVANIGMCKSCSHNLRLRVACDRASLWIRRRSYLELRVVFKSCRALRGVSCIKSNLYIHKHILSFKGLLIFSKFWGAALDSCAVNDSCVHIGSVENAFCLPKAAHFNKVLSLNSYLSVAVSGTARWFNADHLRSFIVEKADGLRLRVNAVTVICYS